MSRATQQPGMWGMAVAADDETTLTRTAALVADCGFVPVPIGGLDVSAVLDPGGPIFPNMYLPADMSDLVTLWRDGRGS